MNLNISYNKHLNTVLFKPHLLYFTPISNSDLVKRENAWILYNYLLSVVPAADS